MPRPTGRGALGLAWLLWGCSQGGPPLPPSAGGPDTPPQVTLGSVADGWDEIRVPLTLRDAEGDHAQIEVAYSTGGDFHTASRLPGDDGEPLPTSKSGMPAELVWDSRADLGDRNVDGVLVRVIAFDRGGKSAPVYSNGFAVRNRLHLIAVAPGDPGERVVVQGKGFGADPSRVAVAFPAPRAAPVAPVAPESATDGALVVVVPAGVVAGDLVVAVAPDRSNAVPFAVRAAARFAPGAGAPIGAHPTAPTVADVDGDGRIDLVQGTLLLNQGQGRFAPSGPVWGAAPALLGDFDGDGRCDLVTRPAGAAPQLFLGQPGGGFADASDRLQDAAALIGPKPDAVLLDADGDGRPDLLFAGATADGRPRLYLQAGATFLVRDDTVLAQAPPPTAVLGLDLDGDGITDLLLGGPQGAALLRGHGFGTFSPTSAPFGSRPPLADRFLLGADLDGDGAADLVTCAPLGYFQGLGAAGAFLESSLVAGIVAAEPPVAAVLADVNDDGWLDLYAVAPGRVHLFVSHGPGVFVDEAAAAGLLPPVAPRGAVAADLDGDGKLDLYDGERLSWNRSQLGNGSVEVALGGAWAGARLTLTTPDGVRQVRTVASSALPIHLGLGAAQEAHLEVHWASGQVTTRSVAPGDRLALTSP